ncbi:hypothetical protein GQX73_g10709 [Xylaria multiplex]|uniref:Uncharacterized protein n=1 Tax=Xylaria multiplex TaxID=323545 RepID=A0A7C8MZK5_9PEZI|nr:hypothetical protein GQX73_g10709 [Xylaria multiplex]
MQTHLWQSYSNGKYGEIEDVDTRGDPAFNQRVLMFLKGERVTNPVSNGYRGYVAPTGPGINANLYNRRPTDRTTVYIFTPCKPGVMVVGIDSTVLVRPYVPVNVSNPIEEAELGTNNRGAVLFQYDPNSDGKGKKAWRLFQEKEFDYREVP